MSVKFIKNAFFTAVLFFFLISGLYYQPLYIHADTPTETPTDTPTETPTPDTSITPSLTPTQSQSNTDTSKAQELQKQIEELQNKVNELTGQKKTLSSQISVMNSQIKLTELRINATQSEISTLEDEIGTASKKITNLESSLNDLMKILVNRIVATYEVGGVQPLHTLLSSGNMNDFFARANYLKVVQEHDKQLIYDTQQAKNDYVNQKNIFETKKKRVEALKIQLESYTSQIAQEKKSKQDLLDITNNDEQKYQDMLAAAKAEYNAIQGINSGYGHETEIGDIKEGDPIASIIQGASPCSTGTHLHFEVDNNGVSTNPASYLSSKDVDWDLCGWYGCDGSFGFSGSWSWPVNGKPRITQGYGMTAYARSGAYGGGPHTGIDMYSDDSTVKAVKDGKLYAGGISCGGGTLHYVKVHHNDTGLDSLYLHVYSKY